MKTRIKIINFFAILLSFVALLSLIYGIWNYSTLEGVVNDNLKGYGLIGVFVFAFIFDLIPNYIAPHIGIINAGLFDINIFYATILVILGSTLGSILGYWIGKKYGIEVVKEFVNRNDIEKFKKEMNKYGKWVVLVGAFSPIPYLPLLIGSLYFTKKNFIYYGLIPRILSFIIVGIFVGIYL